MTIGEIESIPMKYRNRMIKELKVCFCGCCPEYEKMLYIKLPDYVKLPKKDKK